MPHQLRVCSLEGLLTLPAADPVRGPAPGVLAHMRMGPGSFAHPCAWPWARSLHMCRVIELREEIKTTCVKAWGTCKRWASKCSSWCKDAWESCKSACRKVPWKELIKKTCDILRRCIPRRGRRLLARPLPRSAFKRVQITPSASTPFEQLPSGPGEGTRYKKVTGKKLVKAAVMPS